MEQFPKIAKARLAAERPGPHPDAEQLSAFSENALGAGERETVLAHLAACVDCRDIVGLAAAARPADAPVVKPVRGGFRWATFQWAAVAASLAIVTVAVLVVGPHQAKREQQATETAQLKQEPVSAAPAAKPSEPVANETGTRAAKSVPGSSLREQASPRREEADAKLDRDSKLKAKSEAGYSADGATITDGGFGGIGVYSRVYGAQATAPSAAVRGEKKKQAEAAGPVAKSAPADQYSNVAPSPRQTDSLAAGRVTGEKQPAPAALQEQTNAPQTPPATAADKEESGPEFRKNARNDVSKDQQAANAEFAVATDSAELAKAHVAQKTAKGASASSAGIVSTRFDSGTLMWRIASGRVQSSVDNGATWQVRSPAKDVQWTSVAAAGQQVWAGGQSGTVWMSRDAGQSWAKISLTGDDIVPLGNVTSIKITNPLLVDVSLSNGDDWQSTDGGKSFRLLPKKEY